MHALLFILYCVIKTSTIKTNQFILKINTSNLIAKSRIIMESEEFSELSSTYSYGSFFMRVVSDKRTYNLHPFILVQNIATYPISMTRILCQLGYEPLPLEVGTTLFSKTYLEKAYLGKTNDQLCLSDYTYFLKQLAKQSVAICVGITVSRPFRTLLCRTVAQLIFDEKKYTGSIFRRFCTAYEETGFMGFFSGVVAELIGEMCFLWISAHILRYLKKMILEQNEEERKRRRTELIFPGFATFIIPRILRGKFYPFHLVATIMAVNGSSLKVGNPPFYPVFDRWYNCYAYLSEIKHFDRGRKMFNRVYKGAYESLNGKLYALPY
ncbi:Mitochondrial carrier -like protein 2 [Trichinella patagoniensis]|uniref:Mitochondrial carrier-like protein 2 n=1 Tax=Trichinella patagoniensis TaxID=990121 RepID=A0A0V0ZTF3_9BILA|nr:Mitochondrial carrier -like protein 2 [Trichinella patagoniensis]